MSSFFSSLRVFSWWKSQLLTLLFCFNFSWRNSRLDPNPLGGHGNTGGFSWCFCGAVFPSVQKTPKRLHTPSRDTFKQQEVHRRSLESSRLPLERHQKSHRSDPADERAISQFLPLADVWHGCCYCGARSQDRGCAAVVAGWLTV